MNEQKTWLTLNENLPVLFVYIGWARYYDGTEPIDGGFAWFQQNPNEDKTESNAFFKDEKGYFRCGIGDGAIYHDRIHIVFVARDPSDNVQKVVGYYAAAKTKQTGTGTWSKAYTRNAILIPAGKRPKLLNWPAGRGMRRWAWRDDKKGKVYSELHLFFQQQVKLAGKNTAAVSTQPPEVEDYELSAFEGKTKKYFIIHRKREVKLRRAKIREALKQNNGRLICEVPECSFDFYERYGELGQGYAQVHHLQPLAKITTKETITSITDLAIVCANCHAMIHIGGECRQMQDLIPK